MALRGAAFLGLWHDIQPEAQAEYDEWHTREHMPERLALPGFLMGRRLVDRNAETLRYGTIYEATSVEAFRSPEYLARLNAPSAWSAKMMPFFRNMLRVSCERVATSGPCDGGAMMTVRLMLPGGEARFTEAAPALVAALNERPGIVGAHAAVARPEASSIRTNEMAARPKSDVTGFDAVVLVEGVGIPELQREAARLLKLITASRTGAARPAMGIYEVACSLAGKG